MLRKLIEWLKWRVAGAELATLERYRSYGRDAQRWLVEFPEARLALDHVICGGEGFAKTHISHVRAELAAMLRDRTLAEAMRARGVMQRPAMLGPEPEHAPAVQYEFLDVPHVV